MQAKVRPRRGVWGRSGPLRSKHFMQDVPVVVNDGLLSTSVFILSFDGHRPIGFAGLTFLDDASAIPVSIIMGLSDRYAPPTGPA
jgi:hypothetical protein